MRIIHTIVILLLAGSVSAQELVLEREDDRYTMRAKNVPLSSLLQRIEVMEGVAIRHFGDDDRLITASYRNVSLDQLLSRLRVSYALVYEPDDMGGYRLGDAMMLRQDQSGLSSERRAHVLKLIRDFRDDDIRGNAHRAVRELGDIVCEIVPLLEDALFFDDYQGRQLAAQMLRRYCDDYLPSDRMLEVTLDLLSRDEYDFAEYWSLFGPGSAFHYLCDKPELAPRIRDRLLHNLSSRDMQERFLSAALLAEYGETALAGDIVRILAPHLMDNDIRHDGGVAAHALYNLGPSVLPYLSPYRNSSDVQQAELADWICASLQSGSVREFEPEMYVNTVIENPLAQRPYLRTRTWRLDRFPDENGVYHNLNENRWTRGQRLRGDNLPSWREMASQPSGMSADGPADPVSSASVDYADANDPFPYAVRQGDTVHTIARDFAVTMKDIIRLNDAIDDAETPLQPRTIVLIPPLL